MRSFIRLISRFRDDERGVFAVMFGLFAVVLIAMAGAMVDFTSIEVARSKAQQALDSAALGLQPTIFRNAPTSEQYKTTVKALLDERLGNSDITTTIDVAKSDANAGTLHLEGTVTVNTAFVTLVGVKKLTAKIVSEATRKQLDIELAMVLDNSGSMANEGRMTNLIQAARCATNVLLSGSTDCSSANLGAEDNKPRTSTNIKIGLVPFTGLVNVGTNYRNASWMDAAGTTSIANDNFDDDDNEGTEYNGPVNRFDLFNKIGVAWKGCVEARRYPYDVNDEPPVSGDTLFVPLFAPDEPDSGGTYYMNYLSDTPAACSVAFGTWTRTMTKTNCANNNSAATAYNNCGSAPASTYTLVNASGQNITPAPTNPPTTMKDGKGYDRPATCVDTFNTPIRVTNSNYTTAKVTTCTYRANLTQRVLQERLCKYAASNPANPLASWRGPNSDCPSAKIAPLTDDKASIITAIKAMVSDGSTDIHQGASWGYHMLSPSEPLTEALPYATTTLKVMILMTDGENTIYGWNANMNKNGLYMAYGYIAPAPYNGRLTNANGVAPTTEAEGTAMMDARTLETCNNAKKPLVQGGPDKIVIYTIGLSAPNQKTKDLLTACATDPSKAFFPTDPTTLTKVFKDIAEELSQLRLSK